MESLHRSTDTQWITLILSESEHRPEKLVSRDLTVGRTSNGGQGFPALGDVTTP